jgi:hypothetical protein
MLRRTKLLAIWFAFLYFVPIAISAGLYYLDGKNVDWWSADPSSTGLLPSPVDHPEAVVRIFSARTVRWRGIVASHSWIVVKDRLAPTYQRFDYTAWGEPISVDRFAPDARWFGSKPDVVFSAAGERAAVMIPRIRATSRVIAMPSAATIGYGRGRIQIPSLLP